MTRAVVGLTPDVKQPGEGKPAGSYIIRTSYVESVLRAGGLPIVLPYVSSGLEVAAFLERIDALVVTGGAFDVPAELYGERAGAGMGELKRGRTDFELAMIRGALEADMPLLGVCGGMQLLNVAFGGSLHQDILGEVRGAMPHEQGTDPRGTSHQVEVLADSLLARCSGGLSAFAVNSTHHQAVKTPGPGLVVSARAPDGVIEAVEDPGRAFVMGVQWHPELLAGRHEGQQEIYDALVRAARLTR